MTGNADREAEGAETAREPTVEEPSSTAPGGREPTIEELLDNTPEAVAMRRARVARAEAEAQRARVEARPAFPRFTRRRVVLGAMGAILAAGALARLGRER